VDALPGQQRIIETKHNSGAITEEESYYQKKNLQQEVDFYGAMDGSSKFVSGYVKISILITALSILGGIIIGITLRGEPVNSAIETYIPLSIGACLLITYFPVLLLSIAIGVIITRSVPNISLEKGGPR
jgi:flagellar biosynthesis protein FlhA